MKYSCSIDINVPLVKTVALWEDESNFKNWQDGFVRIDHLCGVKNTKGAKSRIIFHGKRKIELMETIILSQLPKYKIARYEHVHMTNTQATRFVAKSPTTTHYISEVEYTKFNGILIKIMIKLFPGKFKAQSQKWMQQFKDFAESTYRSTN